ncbi:MAG: hypothetical protein JSV19_02690 [Phycisphaerales bacterium]|nr:MAG: hypothetical protein JSV19_02690 [Phycisphaerales bacterium]
MLAPSRDGKIHPASYPLKDPAAAQIKADVMRTSLPTTVDGTGVNVAVLDSSLDINDPDIPAPIEAYDVTEVVP